MFRFSLVEGVVSSTGLERRETCFGSSLLLLSKINPERLPQRYGWMPIEHAEFLYDAPHDDTAFYHVI